MGLSVQCAGFSVGELDSLMVFRYEKNNLFNVFIDSQRITRIFPFPYTNIDTVSVDLSNIFIDTSLRVSSFTYYDTDYDIMLVNKILNDTNWFSNVIYDERTQCVSRPSFEHRSCTSPIVGYTLNDTIITVDAFEKIYFRK